MQDAGELGHVLLADVAGFLQQFLLLERVVDLFDDRLLARALAGAELLQQAQDLVQGAERALERVQLLEHAVHVLLERGIGLVADRRDLTQRHVAALQLHVLEEFAEDFDLLVVVRVGRVELQNLRDLADLFLVAEVAILEDLEDRVFLFDARGQALLVLVGRKRLCLLAGLLETARTAGGLTLLK